MTKEVTAHAATMPWRSHLSDALSEIRCSLARGGDRSERGGLPGSTLRDPAAGPDSATRTLNRLKRPVPELEANARTRSERILRSAYPRSRNNR